MGLKSAQKRLSVSDQLGEINISAWEEAPSIYKSIISLLHCLCPVDTDSNALFISLICRLSSSSSDGFQWQSAATYALISLKDFQSSDWAADRRRPDSETRCSFSLGTLSCKKPRAAEVRLRLPHQYGYFEAF